MVYRKPSKPAAKSAPQTPAVKPAVAQAAPVKTPPAKVAVAKATPAKNAAAPKAVEAPKPAPVKVEAKPVPAVARTAPTAPVAKAAPVVPPPVAVTPPPLPKPVVPQPETIAAETADKVVEVAAKAVAPVAEVAAKPIDKPAAAPVAAAKPFTPLPAAKPTQKGIFAMVETVTPQAFVPTPEHVQALFGDLSTRAKKAVENSTKLAEELSEFTKGNVEALMASSRVAAKGAETLGQEAATYSKKSLETATAAFKGFAAAKSPTELFKLQSDYARTSFDAAVVEGSKFSEALMKLIGEISQPISTRVAIAAEKIKTPAF
ncbi:MAG TPA: TIGR01841 family phasin [Sphingomonas sp.]